MNCDALMESFSFLDDGLIERSERRRAPAAWYKWAGMAACFAVLAGVFFASGVTETKTPAQLGTHRAPETVLREWRVNAPAVPYPNGGEGVSRAFPPMIEDWDTGAGACYAAPKNGSVSFSVPLRGALEANGDGALYHLVIDLFRDEVLLPPDGPEAASERERLAGLGCTVAYKVYTDGAEERAYFTLRADGEQLREFAADGRYGYMMFLFGERVHPEEG
ncbi:MAG: hypothetical protein IK136_01900 [Oscillospiraceae bacterium]|nr:hypothetical protein [Oscillospiraceae bacterium]